MLVLYVTQQVFASILKRIFRTFLQPGMLCQQKKGKRKKRIANGEPQPHVKSHRKEGLKDEFFFFERDGCV